MFKKLFGWLFKEKKQSSNVHFATGSQNGMTLQQATELAKQGYKIREIHWAPSNPSVIWDDKTQTLRWENNNQQYMPAIAAQCSSAWICCGKVN